MNPPHRSQQRTHRGSDTPPSGSDRPSRAIATAKPAPLTNTKPEKAGAPGGGQTFGIRSWPAGLIILLAVLFFILYLFTTSRSVPPGDSGELITAAWNLGVAHQPGYPTFTILSHIAGLFPVGTPAFRLNLLSALLDSLALGVLGFGALRLMQAKSSTFKPNLDRLVPIMGVIGGVGLLAVSTAFWQYSNVAEVFALNNLLSALTIVLMLEWVRRPTRGRFLWFSSLCAGLALTNQLTIVLLAPGLFTLLIGGLLRWRREMRASLPGRRLQKKVKDPGWPLRDIGIAAALLVAGLLPYIYLPLAARTDPSINFGNPSTLGNFWSVVTRSDYGTFSFTADSAPGDRFQQLFFIGRYFLHSFTPVGVVLAVLGLIWFARKQRLEGLGLGLAFLFSGPLFAIYANPQLNLPLTQGVFERFYILPGLPMAFFVSAGIVLVIEVGRRMAAKLRAAFMPWIVIGIGLCAIVAMLVVIVIARFPSLDMSHDRVLEYYGRELLEPLEPDSLLIMTNDYNYGSVVYMQNVLGFRTDVVAIHAELLKGTWYVDQQRRLHPEITIPFTLYDEGKKSSLADLIRSNLDHRPVYGAGNFKEDLTKSYDEVNWGLSYRFLKKGEGTDPYALMRPQISRFTSFHYPEQAYPSTSWEALIAQQYGELAFNIAFDLQQPNAQPDADFVEKMYRIAILNAPAETSAYENLGIVLWKNGGSPAEIIALWEKYLQLVPNSPQKDQIRSLITTLKGQP